MSPAWQRLVTLNARKQMGAHLQEHTAMYIPQEGAFSPLYSQATIKSPLPPHPETSPEEKHSWWEGNCSVGMSWMGLVNLPPHQPALFARPALLVAGALGNEAARVWQGPHPLGKEEPINWLFTSGKKHYLLSAALKGEKSQDSDCKRDQAMGYAHLNSPSGEFNYWSPKPEW